MRQFLSPRLGIPGVLLTVSVCSVLLGATQPPVAPGARTLTVLFDNTVSTAGGAGCTAGWGFSAVIEGAGRTILFDSGADAAVFRRNVESLRADLSKVDLVFVSHDHADHTGGLPVMLEKKAGVPVYVPAAARAEFQAELRSKGGQVKPVGEPLLISPGLWSTGDLGESIHEQALVIDTPRGLVLVTGCAHPGIVSIVEKARAVGKKDVWMVLGGFHLLETPSSAVETIVSRFKTLGVQRVGATHCTGEPAIAAFRAAYGAAFVELGVGRKLEL
jgi:7,8-dihydropterin-6-yl-methyl-4-(beta-D-ribofuranosyl)aminobenzene 5'-phosphate synthase